MPPTLRPRTASGVVKPPPGKISDAAFYRENQKRLTGPKPGALKRQWDEDWAEYINSKERKWAPGTDESKLNMNKPGRKEIRGSEGK
jgi:hypothetical protein